MERKDSRISVSEGNVMKIYAILEWDIKERAFRLIEAYMTARAKRIMTQRYKVLCARYPNNSFRLVSCDAVNIEQRIVHSDALTAMRLSEADRYGIAQK